VPTITVAQDVITLPKKIEQTNKLSTYKVHSSEKVSAEAQATLLSSSERIRELEQELREAKAELLAAKSAQVVSDLQSINLSGLSGLTPDKRRVQWVITSSKRCMPCGLWLTNAKAILPKEWEISEKDYAHFRINYITDEEWSAKGYTLPRAELYLDDRIVRVIEANEMNPLAMARDFNAYDKPLSGSEQLNGIAVGSLPVKPQVVALLRALYPFLDGGTLQVIYTPKPGVVKEYLTIAQGSIRVKIPAKTSFHIGMSDANGLSIKFDEPAVMVGASFVERGIKSIDLTPNRLSIRLPWMIDPETNIVDP